MPTVKVKVLKKKLNSEVLEYIDKNTIKFKFSYTNSSEADAYCEEPTRYRFIGQIKETNDYEDYLFIKFWLTNFTDDLENKDCYRLLDIFLSQLKRKYCPFLKHDVVNLTAIDELEINISNIKEIQNKLQSSFKRDGYPSIDLNVLFSNKKAMTLIKNCVKLIKADICNWLEKTDSTSLKKSFYSENFEYLVKLLNINTTSKAYEWMQTEFYKANYYFERNLLMNKDNQSLVDVLNDCPRSILTDVSDAIDTKDIHLRSNFFAVCLRKYNSMKEFEDAILTKIHPSTLSEKDFKHIAEFKYMKSLLANALKNKEKGINILLWGAPGTGKTELAKVLIKTVKANGYLANNQEAGNLDCAKDPYNLRRTNNDKFIMTKELLISKENSILLYDEAEDFFLNSKDIDANFSKALVNDLLENNKTPMIWTTNDPHYLPESFLRRFTYVCEVNEMPKTIYRNLYNKLLVEYGLKDSKEIFNLCQTNKISIGIVKKVFENSNKANGNTEDIITDLKNLYKVQNYGHELKVKNKTSRPKDFDSNLLNTSDDLKTFTKMIKSVGRLDFSLLLYGVSGSGKSYYAEYLAEQLGIPVIKKKASDLESCWVGETEKNIAAAFREAERDKAMLIIDEGDHFISDRSKHRASWETSRTEEMLQQIEGHKYPVVFTTNLIENIDKAAMRRFTYKTKFDYLTTDQVKIAWKDYFPKAKLPTEIHLSRLCPGDFATVYKKAEFENYLTDSNKIYQKLEEEQAVKKEFADNSIRL